MHQVRDIEPLKPFATDEYRDTEGNILLMKGPDGVIYEILIGSGRIVTDKVAKNVPEHAKAMLLDLRHSGARYAEPGHLGPMDAAP